MDNDTTINKPSTPISTEQKITPIIIANIFKKQHSFLNSYNDVLGKPEYTNILYS